MIEAKYDWQFRPKVEDQDFIAKAKTFGLEESVADLLYQRGVQSKEALEAFLKPNLEDLADPFLFHDMEKAVARIEEAIQNGEAILVYGDYDADGMTSASIMKEVLEEMGAEVEVYLPNRFTDGYGPNKSVYKYFIENQKISLIITVDNGVAGHEALEYANEVGVDVIVTDHHALPEVLPPAYAIIHPELPGDPYPFHHLAGVGVAFKLACALVGDVVQDFLDLVAIGTIADMVPLVGENRILVSYGLKILQQTQRIGLQELAAVASLKLDEANEETVGFQIAPRLNALGRLDDPNPALELLTGFDDEVAHELAQMIDAKNTERKELVQAIYEEARAQLDPEAKAQVLVHEGWNPGVLGIVAGRLLEETGQPVIVLSSDGEKAKGSARSPERIHLFEALDPHRELFVAFGGHAGAAGMTLALEKVPALKAVLEDYIANLGLDPKDKPAYQVDETLDLQHLSLKTLEQFQQLAPFGMENRQPVFYISDFQVEASRSMGQGNAHLKLKISQGESAFEVVGFGYGNLALEFSQAKKLQLLVTLAVNQWNGQTSLQLMMVDARIDGLQLYNIRSAKLPLPDSIPVLEFTEDFPANVPQARAYVLDQLPEIVEPLARFVQERQPQVFYFKNTIKEAYYLTGVGTRDQFALLYKTIKQFPEFDVRYKLNELATYLKIQRPLLIKMLQIFQELEFVTIEDGILKENPNAARRSIEESQIYQNLKELAHFQEKMALDSVEDIYDYLLHFPLETL
ncbi:single-stranded-DNA-specific exonuclease RecJ [Streptococcus sp. NLN76]|uniref:single-stranded-DNA-specific exonuclease RecJ n=1 Tax=Streptococcus sp. NLN76 TaxID=2822800 RepID=UPI0018A9579F|nr:single-stranded-DNA-specific exonuclease RecJ [Streptococcus sp. NLN76]MBF8969434.1 single-stranded-DNA-specific exonuclease RecJ [Streptococcus sp. NLN76]